MPSYNDPHHNFIYNHDASHLENSAQTEIFFPNNKNDLIEIVEKAIQEKKKIICRGGGTNLVGNCLPSETSLIVDLSKMNRILHQTPTSLTVEPALTTDEINEKLKPLNLYFPVQLWSHQAAQIGGMIATNGAGMRAIKYGKMQQRVEEIEVLIVNEEGKIEIKTLSHEDANDFFWAEGRFWIVLSATLKVIELPTKKSLIFKTFEKGSEALEFVKEIKKEKKSELSAMELINPWVSELLWWEKKYAVIIEFENETEGDITDPEEIQNIRAKRDACYAVSVNAGFPQIEDPELHDHEMEFLQRCEDHEILMYGHIGIGVLHPHFNDSQKDLIHEMYQLVQKLWGKISGEHGIGKKKQEYLSEEDKSQFQVLKEKWDPCGLFGF